MNSAIKIILDATGGKYNKMQKALTLTCATYRQLGGERLNNPDRVILDNIAYYNHSLYSSDNPHLLYSSDLPTQMYQHPKFPNARTLAFNNCNKYFVSDLISKEKHLYPYLETFFSNTKDFGDIDIFKSDTTHLTRIYICDKDTWNYLPEIAKIFGLKNFEMYKKENTAIYRAAKYDDRIRYVHYINPDEFSEWMSGWQSLPQKNETKQSQSQQLQQLQLQC